MTDDEENGSIKMYPKGKDQTMKPSTIARTFCLRLN